jgi:HAD superfamily hydrolase (TIGR01458 family)
VSPDESSLEEVEALLLDLSGVLYVEDEAVPGAGEALERLRSSGLGIRLVTNTTMRSRRQILERLQRLGFEAEAEELLTPATLAAQHCRDAGYRQVSLLVADDLREDLAELEEGDSQVDAVVMGDLGKDFTYDALNEAFRRVMDGAELVALQKNRYWQTEEGLSLDAGPFVVAVEYGADRQAVVVGKPAPSFFELAVSDLGVEAAVTAMVGDDVEADVGGALEAGIAGILVRTGKYREEDVRSSGIEPTATVDSIADVPDLLGS